MKKKVNIYYAGFNHRVGGAYFHVVNIEKGLKELGYEIDVITLDRLPILIKYLPHILQKIGNTVKFPIGFLWKQWLIKIFYKCMFKDSSDIEIFEDIYTYWKSDTNSIVVLHALWSDNLQGFGVREEQRKMLEKKEAIIINGIDVSVVTVSEPYRNFLLSRLNSFKLKKDLAVIELGIDIENFSVADNNDKSIVFVGLLEARKNIKFLLDVYKKLKDLDNEFTLSIIGDGTQRSELEEYVKQNSIQDIIFKGKFSHDEVVKELPKYSYYLHTSTKESFSYSLLEAKLSGLKTIAFSGLEVPNEFIDLKIADFEIDTWLKAILEYKPTNDEFVSNRFSYQRMTYDTLKKLK